MAESARGPLLSKLLVLIKHPTSHGGIQFLRYGGVAAISFVADFGLLYLFTSKLKWYYLLSTTLAFVLSAIVNYALSTWWVFSQRVERHRSIELALFIAICTVALGLNDIFMWIFTSVFGIFYLASKLLTVGIVFFWSFGARRVLFSLHLRSLLPKSMTRKLGL